jgi:hypothetical protein
MADLLIKCHYDKHEADTDKRVDTAQSMKMLMMYWMVISIVIIQSVEQNSLNEINYERNTCNRKFKHRYGD